MTDPTPTGPTPRIVTRTEAIGIVRGSTYRAEVSEAAGEIVDGLVMAGVLVLEREGDG